MRRILSLFFLLLLLATGSVAGAQRAPAPAAPALWEVRDGESTAWLFGTVHALPRGVDWFKPHIARALDQSTMLVLETELPSTPDVLTPVVMKMARLATASPLPDRVPEGWRPALGVAMARLKAGPMDWYKTWFAALTLTNLQSDADGFDPRIGVEAVLGERARMDGLPIKGLESVEEQLSNFDSLTEAEQQAMLLSTLQDLSTDKERTTALIGDWMAGNTARLAEVVNHEFANSPRLRRMLVEDRNLRWADLLQERMKRERGPIFVAVGAGHLAGPGSLIEQFRARGMEVRRVPAAPAAARPPQPRRK